MRPFIFLYFFSKKIPNAHSLAAIAIKIAKKITYEYCNYRRAKF